MTCATAASRSAHRSACIDDGGLGAEVDLGHTRRFDDLRFVESGITSLMVNASGMYPQLAPPPLRRRRRRLDSRAHALAIGEPVTNRTDWGFNAGGGVQSCSATPSASAATCATSAIFQRHEDLPLLDNGFFDYWRTSIGRDARLADQISRAGTAPCSSLAARERRTGNPNPVERADDL